MTSGSTAKAEEDMSNEIASLAQPQRVIAEIPSTTPSHWKRALSHTCLHPANSMWREPLSQQQEEDRGRSFAAKS